MGRSRVAIALVAVLGTTASCTLFTSFGGFVGADDESPSGDSLYGGGASNDAALVEIVAPFIEDGGDASAVIDGSIKDSASEAAVEAGPIDCQGFLFCDGFDDRSSTQGSWGQVVATGGSSIGLDSTAFVSTGHSLRVNAFAGASSGNEREASVSKTFAYSSLANGVLHVEFDVKLVADLTGFAAGSDTNYLTYLETYTIGPGFGVFSGGMALARNIADSNLATYPTGTRQLSPASTPGMIAKVGGAFTHVVYELTFSSTAGRNYITADGAVILDRTNVITLPSGSTPTSVRVLVGVVPGSGTIPNFTGYYDNVKIK